jgi:hypothetical protein
MVDTLGGDVAALIVLNLSAAFDTVDHDIYNDCKSAFALIMTSFGSFSHIFSVCLSCVRHLNCQLRVTYGVPQGSVLGLLLFVLSLADLTSKSPQTLPQLYADDTQIYDSR